MSETADYRSTISARPAFTPLSRTNFGTSTTSTTTTYGSPICKP